MKWETVIGLEIHAQLSTRSKMFSGAATAFGAAPNTQACAVDIALPGVLPVANREAVAKAVRFGIAIGANINRRSVFARKNYFYPDLPKGYQISQYEMPIVQGGAIPIFVDGREKTVRLTRAHLEEDAGKSLHEGFHDFTGIDLNRAGTPLIEIVSEPDMRSAPEAVAYARAVHALVRWIDICDGNMQEGSFRCDANVSVRPAGSDTLGTRCEIKNLNSFRFLERAIEFEAKRQIEILEDGGKIVQETRLYDADRDETRSMRTKEDAHDYRYFPDPDLLPLDVPQAWVDAIRAEMPELPEATRSAFAALGLSPNQAAALTASRDLADYSRTAFAGAAAPTELANWIAGALTARLNDEGMAITESRIAPSQLRDLVARVTDGTLSGKMAREVFDAVWAGEGEPDAIIARRGLRQISDSGELETICDEVIAGNARQVADYRSGKDRAFNSLVGQVMKATQGKANPQQVSEILRRKLAG
ncbi:MAG TPA: Asp-tRNA(Asn)/Glu-tRNA(Gln) amidotransferase subunit GatB [Burkholderiales bacterium]|nr:Asp-tRNA(Asn)/Glu-tRNA(Gln) amidotransferase subunit GatB [Burkholderiales bacterium]